MKKTVSTTTVVLFVGLLVIAGVMLWRSAGQGGKPDSPDAGSLVIFCGSASKPATEEAAELFESKTGAKLLLHFGGSGKMLSDMKLSRRGDLYFPGSSDFMELAKKDELVLPETERRIAYLLPAINVPAGNPKGIRSLADLAKPGVRLGIARPDTVCVGLYAVEVLQRNGLADRVKPNIVTFAESCAKTANLAGLGTVDAVIGWRVFHYWQPDKIETILLEAHQVPRIGYIPIAKSVFCENQELADKFIEFLLSEEGKQIFRKWHYLESEDQARELTEANTPVGGEWRMPDKWMQKK